MQRYITSSASIYIVSRQNQRVVAAASRKSIPVVEACVNAGLKQHWQGSQAQHNTPCALEGQLVNLEAGPHEDDSQASCADLGAPGTGKAMYRIYSHISTLTHSTA